MTDAAEIGPAEYLEPGQKAGLYQSQGVSVPTSASCSR
jgi:hypothetical protein